MIICILSTYVNSLKDTPLTSNQRNGRLLLLAKNHRVIECPKLTQFFFQRNFNGTKRQIVLGNIY